MTEKVSLWAGLQTLRFADRVVTDSRSTLDDFAALNLLPRRQTAIGYCGPGILPSNAEADYAKQFVPFVLYVGSQAPHKNVIRLIHAFGMLRAERDLKLVLVGSASDHQLGRLERTVGKLRLQSRVVLHHSVSEPQLSSLYQHCRLFVCPSIYEGFGLPVLEAMLHGAPVACSSVSSLPEVTGDAAVLFDPHSVPDMSDKMRVLLDNNDLAAKLSENGLRRAALFSWERTARTIYEIAAGLA